MMKDISIIIALFLTSIFSYGNDYYVAPNGNDANIGSKDKPVENIKRAQELANSGDTV